MRTITTFILTLFFAQSVFAQNIPYSSSKKYEKIDVKEKKYRHSQFSKEKIEDNSVQINTVFLPKRKEKAELLADKK